MSKELITAFVNAANGIYGLDLACWAVNNVWENIYLDIMPQILIDSFGTFPGYWSMVSDEDYIRAKENVFHNADGKWDSFIEIIDSYHYNVQTKAPELLKNYTERGIYVSNITKYGYQTIPLTAPSDVLSDGYCTVAQASMGATAANLSTTLSDEYIASHDSRYISPDRQIDASTCLFPERTWFVKNIQHKYFPEQVNVLLEAIVNNHGMTVDSDENLPQYMVLRDDWSFVPLTAENQNTTERYERNFWESLKMIFDWLGTKIKEFIASKTAE